MVLSAQAFAQQTNTVLWKNDAFSVYSNGVVQAPFSAKILSPEHIVSDYKSQQHSAMPAVLDFKISINGQDNESPSGQDHHLVIHTHDAQQQSPVIVFGKPFDNVSASSGDDKLTQKTTIILRVDMRQVLKSMDENGYYTTYAGKKIYKADFKGVYVAGGTAPLSWDFDNLVNHPDIEMKDPDGDGIYELSLTLDPNSQEGNTAQDWTLAKKIEAFPLYHSPYPISDALYNLSLDEMINAVEPDSTFRTGKEWAGVWTRDISYSIILSMAHLQPNVAFKSLMRKVNGKKIIIQDTGTGGAWPCSSDRVIWAVAAWELYKYTGNQEWLATAYEIIRNTLAQDEVTIYDHATGLVKGESSFLDWREQTYPRWMQPADIFESECLGTNAVHFQANIVAGKMAALLGHKLEAARYNANAARIKKGINQYLWMPDKGYYAQYIYGRNYKTISPKAETLGEALCVIWDIADSAQQKKIVANTPEVAMGTPCIFPEISGIPPYHNNAVWPFVQTFWLWAAAKADHPKSVMKSIASIYRSAALFATNKENFVAQSGDYAGTQINSSNMLWSLSGNLSLVHKVLFGINFTTNGLSFHPFVPKELQGDRSLSGLRYHDAILNIKLSGYGNEIVSYKVDGKKVSTNYIIAKGLNGTHQLEIVLANKFKKPVVSQNIQPVIFAPETPTVHHANDHIYWSPVANAIKYDILKNGKIIFSTTDTIYQPKGQEYAEYSVAAIDKNNYTSFIAEPISIRTNSDDVHIYPMVDFAAPSQRNSKGFESKGFVEISLAENKEITIAATIKNAGWYAIDFHYANGNGPTNTENKCAIRTLTVDGKLPHTIVFPQRGKNEWSNWGFSNSVQFYLTPGLHKLALSYRPVDENMNEKINMALLDYIRLEKIKK